MNEGSSTEHTSERRENREISNNKNKKYNSRVSLF